MRNDSPTEIRRYCLGPLTIHDIDQRKLIEVVGNATDAGQELSISYLNAHGCNLVFKNNAYAATLGTFDIIFCDGVGAMLAFRFLGAPIPQRMTPPDFVEDLLQRVSEGGQGTYLVGDEPGVSRQAEQSLPSTIRASIRGTHHGFFPESEESELLQEIAKSQARLILVGTGMPRQEAFIQRARKMLPGRVWLGVGALFRWMAGVEKRGPRWATDNGLEWLCRLVVQPRTVAKRYLVGLPAFAVHVAKLKASQERFK